MVEQPQVIKLYDLTGAMDRRFSSNCWRTRFALAHKGLIYETIPTKFTQIPVIADGRQKTVPVIDDAGTVVGDSWAIANYLETKYADRPSLFGADAGRAYSIHLQGWLLANFSPKLFPLIVTDIWSRLDEADQPYFRASREQRFGMSLEDVVAGSVDEKVDAIHLALKPIRAVLAEQPFLGGSSPLYPDYLMASSFIFARAVSPINILPPDDMLAAWFERMLDLFGGLGRANASEWNL